MTRLQNAPWLAHEGLRAIGEALALDGQKPLAVGGAVRDSLIGLPVSDVDIATPLLPQEVVRRLETAGIKAIPTGIEHGTITAVALDKTYEITTFRRDVATDGRRATVAFSNDWREDAERRDFTINALYADIESGEVYDSVGGLSDLEARHIRFIGDPAMRIAEDHLRILRYFRFLARFGEQQVDPAAVAACRAARDSLKSLSRERIASELTRMMLLPDPVFAVQQMIAADIFSAFLSELRSDAAQRLSMLVEREQRWEMPPSLEARLLCLLPADEEIIDQVASRLKLSNRLRKGLRLRVRASRQVQEDARAMAYWMGKDVAIDHAMLNRGDDQSAEALSRLDGWTVPEFPVKGRDIIAGGVRPGPEVARILAGIEKDWVAQAFPDGEALTAIIARYVPARDVKR